MLKLSDYFDNIELSKKNVMLKKKCLEVEKMKLLIIGAGGVGTSAAKIIERRGAEADWAEKVVVSDYDFERAKKVANEICG